MNKDTTFKLKHNVVIRTALKPIMEVKEQLKFYQFQKSQYPDRLREYKNKYKGERCFIIGNGPSLKPEDLDIIKDEKSFAANRIYNIYSKTKWRPSFFVSTDMDILNQEKEKIRKLQGYPKFISYNAKKYFYTEDDINYIFLRGPFEIHRNKFVQDGVSDDVSKYSTKTQTVTCVSMELAMYMGFKEIYLLGVDHSFSKYVDSNGNLVEDKTIQSYFEGMVGGDSQAILYTDDTTACYQVVHEYAEKHGVKIFNATRGGKLEVYPRKSLEEVMEFNRCQ